MFVYSSYFKLAHVGSLDHYVSFLRAPTTAKGPFWLCLYLDRSPRTWDPRVYFYFKHLPIYNWAPFLYWTEKALQILFWGRELMLFFKSSGGSVLRTSTISETSFSEPSWLGVFSVWNSLTLDFGPVLSVLVWHGAYFWGHLLQACSEGGAISFNMDQVYSVGTSYLDSDSGFGSVCETWRLFCKAISLKLAQKGVIFTTFFYACLSSWPLSWCLGLCGGTRLIVSSCPPTTYALTRAHLIYIKFNTWSLCWTSFGSLTR